MALFLSCPFYDPWTFVWLCHASCGTSVPSQQWNPGPLQWKPGPEPLGHQGSPMIPGIRL